MTGEPERIRFITVVFCDVAGSTELAATLSPDVWGAILGRYFSVATDVLTGAGGRMEKFIGDAVVAVFGSAVAREDDAVHAVRAAVALRDSLRAEGQRFIKWIDEWPDAACEAALVVGDGARPGAVA